MAKSKRPLRDGNSSAFEVAFETDPAGDIRPAHLVLGADKLTPASEANPLPVAAGGVEERLDAIEARLAGTLAIQRKAVLEMQVLDNTLDVAAAGTKTVTVTPPAGELWRLRMLGMNVPAPSGASSGTHKVELFSGNSANVNEYMMFQAVSNFADNVRLRMNIAFTATSAVTPTDQAAQVAVLTGIVISEDIPLQIRYTNSTNATATGNWAIKLLVEKETVDS